MKLAVIRDEAPAVSLRSVPWLLPTLSVLFLVSGACALAYQVLWLRLLSLVFGVTIYAATAVLASFMAGLAIGSFGAGRLAARLRNPLAAYAIAELLIGFWALATPSVVHLLENAYVGVYSQLPQSQAMSLFLRLVLSAAVLLVPTTLMGATLPLAIAAFRRSAGESGGRAGWLYAANTLGAVAGTLITGFFLIGELGISKSLAVAALGNGAVALIAFLASLKLGSLDVVSHEPTRAGHVHASAEVAVRGQARQVVLLTFAISGFVALALEVLWFRALTVYIEATTYAFTLMLTSVLGGIAIGSYAIVPFLRLRLNWLLVLGVLEILVGLSAIASVAALAQLPEIMVATRPLQTSSLPIAGEETRAAITSMLVLFPATLCMGLAFPVGLRLIGGSGTDGDASEQIGRLYAVNVVGSIAGSIAAGFILLPLLGTKVSLWLLAGAPIALGTLVLIHALQRRTIAWAIGGFSAGVFALIAAIAPNPIETLIDQRSREEKVLWYHEGVQATVSVVERADGSRWMLIDGLTQASDRAGVPLHRAIGVLPLLLHPEPQRALIIGLGGGSTPGAASLVSNVHVDVVELSEGVVLAAESFKHVNFDVLHRPNVTVTVNDGRNHLLFSRGRYDSIGLDVIRPQHAGSGYVYSREFFQQARDALSENGLMVQWINRQTDAEYRMLMRTFLSVFPDATLWWDGSLMVGTKRPLRLDCQLLERRIQSPELRPVLDGLQIAGLQDMRRLFTAGPEVIARYAGSGPILTDDHPLAEYFLSINAPRRPPNFDGLQGDLQEHLMCS